MRYLPAELLKEVNVVDTPGTNVILSRQQRLTEEYVPRADLVLFVLSADRPFTESEVNFLKYIRRAILHSADDCECYSSVSKINPGVCRACKALQSTRCQRNLIKYTTEPVLWQGGHIAAVLPSRDAADQHGHAKFQLRPF